MDEIKIDDQKLAVSGLEVMEGDDITNDDVLELINITYTSQYTRNRLYTCYLRFREKRLSAYVALEDMINAVTEYKEQFIQ